MPGLLDPPGLTPAGAAAKYLSILDGQLERNIATNVFFTGLGNNGLFTAAGTSRSVHYAAFDAFDIRLGYGNIVLTGTTPIETDGPNIYTIRAAVEYNSKIYPVTFNGSKTLALEGGGFVASDPVNAYIPAGQKFYVRTYISASGTGWYATNRNYSASGCGGFTTGDLTGASAGTIADSDSYMFTPHMITGKPANAASVAVVVCGDSIAGGQGDNAGLGVLQEMISGGTIGRGFIPRALGTTFGRVSICMPGERAYDFVNNALKRRLRVAAGARHAIICYGRNDLATQTAAQIEPSLISVWGEYSRRNARAWQTTITPRTTSTDSWATVGNQTIASTTEETNRVAINTWLRDGAPMTAGAPVTAGTAGASRCAVYDSTGAQVTPASGPAGHPMTGGVIETTDVVETARNSGIWKAAYSVDGIHPSQSAHIAMAATIPVSRLTYA